LGFLQKTQRGDRGGQATKKVKAASGLGRFTGAIEVAFVSLLERFISQTAILTWPALADPARAAPPEKGLRQSPTARERS
jgi:hypothetical protein